MPIKIDIIKHRNEVDGKSTSSHAKILASDDVNIYLYPDIPDYSKEKDELILIFPALKSVNVPSLFQGIKSFDFKENYGLDRSLNMGTLLMTDLNEIISDGDRENLRKDQVETEYTLENLPIKKAVFIDSTWKQCRSIYKDERINSLKSCIIQNRLTKFWRSQKGAPKWYLSTIEAIHQFLLEFHIGAWGISRNYYNRCLDDLQLIDKGFINPAKIVDTEANDSSNSLCKPYDGQYDNLLFFYSFLYCLIHSLDDINGKLK